MERCLVSNYSASNKCQIKCGDFFVLKQWLDKILMLGEVTPVDKQCGDLVDLFKPVAKGYLKVL